MTERPRFDRAPTRGERFALRLIACVLATSGAVTVYNGAVKMASDRPVPGAGDVIVGVGLGHLAARSLVEAEDARIRRRLGENT